MDGAIDLRLVITLLGVAASVFGGAAIARLQIKQLTEETKSLFADIRSLDKRVDTLEAQGGTQKQRIDILAQMSSPENLRREHMQMSELITSVERLKTDCDRLYKMHNGKHPPVSNVRTAE